MISEDSNICVIKCSGMLIDNPSKLKEMLEVTFNMMGGDNKISPYLLSMSNHNIKKDFISGGMVSESLSILLDYTPEKKSLQLKIFSPEKILDEEIVKYIKGNFPDLKVQKEHFSMKSKSI